VITALAVVGLCMYVASALMIGAMVGNYHLSESSGTLPAAWGLGFLAGVGWPILLIVLFASMIRYNIRNRHLHREVATIMRDTEGAAFWIGQVLAGDENPPIGTVVFDAEEDNWRKGEHGWVQSENPLKGGHYSLKQLREKFGPIVLVSLSTTEGEGS